MKNRVLVRGFRNGVLWIIAFALIACTRHTMVKPEPQNLVGKYKPVDLNDNRLRPDSEIDLRNDGTCQLVDFPYIEYESQSSHLTYLTAKGSWAVRTYDGYWDFRVTISGTDFVLNLLRDSPPYQIAQEGEDVDDDILFFQQSR